MKTLLVEAEALNSENLIKCLGHFLPREALIILFFFLISCDFFETFILFALKWIHFKREKRQRELGATRAKGYESA